MGNKGDPRHRVAAENFGFCCSSSFRRNGATVPKASKTAGRKNLRPSTSHLRELAGKRDFYAGGLMLLLGLGIALASLSPSEDGHDAGQNILPENPQWWAWLCILMSPVLFIVFGRYFGMAPGTFACVAIAALGDKDATWRGTLILASVVTVFGVALFSYFLQVPMPIFTWWGAS